MSNSQAPLLRRNGDITQEEFETSDPNTVVHDGVPDSRGDKAGMDSVDRDVEVFGVPQESGLQFCNPHLEIKLVVGIVIAFCFWATAEMVKIEDSEVVKAGSCTYDPGLCAPGQGWKESERQQDMR